MFCVFRYILYTDTLSCIVKLPELRCALVTRNALEKIKVFTTPEVRRSAAHWFIFLKLFCIRMLPAPHTHQNKQSLANKPRLAQPIPLPTMWAILHQRMLERVDIACSVVKYIH